MEAKLDYLSMANFEITLEVKLVSDVLVCVGSLRGSEYERGSLFVDFSDTV